MYGFLDSEYKLRKLDSNTDISYIYDVVREAVSARLPKVSVITYKTQKLIDRYSKIIETREEPIPKIIPFTASDLTTDDERIVLCYILENNVRKVSKDAIIEWLHKNEVFDINIENAFDLLSSFGSCTVNNDILELDIQLFRTYSSNVDLLLPELKSCLENHVRLASDIFKRLWNSSVLDSSTVLFIAYIIEERMSSFGDRWMAKMQIKTLNSGRVNIHLIRCCQIIMIAAWSCLSRITLYMKAVGQVMGILENTLYTLLCKISFSTILMNLSRNCSGSKPSIILTCHFSNFTNTSRD